MIKIGPKTIQEKDLLDIKARARMRAAGFFTAEVLEMLLSKEELGKYSLSGEANPFNKSEDAKEKLDPEIVEGICGK